MTINNSIASNLYAKTTTTVTDVRAFRADNRDGSTMLGYVNFTFDAANVLAGLVLCGVNVAITITKNGKARLRFPDGFHPGTAEMRAVMTVAVFTHPRIRGLIASYELDQPKLSSYAA